MTVKKCKNYSADVEKAISLKETGQLIIDTYSSLADIIITTIKSGARLYVQRLPPLLTYIEKFCNDTD